MHASVDSIKVEISINEAFVLYSTIKHAIEDRIKDHWKNHPDAYEKGENTRLLMMKTLARFTNNDFTNDSLELLRLLETETMSRSTHSHMSKTVFESKKT